MSSFAKLYLACFCLQFDTVRAFDNALMILGGASKIFLAKDSQSKVMNTFEIFGCSDLPVALTLYPMNVFGPSMVWEGVRLADLQNIS